MKTIDLSITKISLNEVLNSARYESVLVKASDGTSFLLSFANEFSSEVELLRRNHTFFAFLDSLKMDQKMLSLEDVEERLR
jgi:hypothetical protein